MGRSVNAQIRRNPRTRSYTRTDGIAGDKRFLAHRNAFDVGDRIPMAGCEDAPGLIPNSRALCRFRALLIEKVMTIIILDTVKVLLVLSDCLKKQLSGLSDLWQKL